MFLRCSCFKHEQGHMQITVEKMSFNLNRNECTHGSKNKFNCLTTCRNISHVQWNSDTAQCDQSDEIIKHVHICLEGFSPAELTSGQLTDTFQLHTWRKHWERRSCLFLSGQSWCLCVSDLRTPSHPHNFRVHVWKHQSDIRTGPTSGTNSTNQKSLYFLVCLPKLPKEIIRLMLILCLCLDQYLYFYD